MKREEFKFLAAGQYAMMKRSSNNIDKQGLDTYVEGALFGYDMALKLFQRETTVKIEQPIEITGMATFPVMEAEEITV